MKGLRGQRYDIFGKQTNFAPKKKHPSLRSRRYRRVRVGLTANVQFRIALPLRVTLTSGGREIGSVVPKPILAPSGRTSVEFDVPAWADGGTLVLRFYRNPKVHTMAIDEIEAY